MIEKCNSQGIKVEIHGSWQFVFSLASPMSCYQYLTKVEKKQRSFMNTVLF